MGKIFFVYYQKKGEPDAAARPLTFCFNDRPGSASVWVHLGGLGPKRVELSVDGAMLAPPYQLVDNEYSWLGKSDPGAPSK